MIQIYKEQRESIEVRLKGVKNGYARVVKNALNKALQTARDDVVDKVRQTYTVKSSNDISKTLEIQKATTKDLTAKLVSRGAAVPLIRFNVRPSKPQYKGKNRPVLFVEVKRGEGGVIKRAFITRVRKTGNLGIFERVGTARYPISQKYGPSIPTMVGSRNVRLHVETNARKILTRLIDEEIEKLMDGR